MPIASTSGAPCLQNYEHKLSLFSIDCPTITAKIQGVCCRYVLLIERRGCGHADGQWDNQNGQPVTGSV